MSLSLIIENKNAFSQCIKLMNGKAQIVLKSFAYWPKFKQS